MRDAWAEVASREANSRLREAVVLEDRDLFRDEPWVEVDGECLSQLFDAVSLGWR